MKIVRTKSRNLKENFEGMVCFEKTTLCILLLIGMFTFSASSLHYDKQTVSFTTLDELLSSGKELKVWSDTSVRILGISFLVHNDPYSSRTNISWKYIAGRSIPCKLYVGDTLRLKLFANYIRDADTPQIDSVCFATGLGQFNCVPLQIGSFPHALVTSNCISGPTSDTAGKCLHFSRDSVFCTLRHPVYYCYHWDDRFHTLWTTTRSAVHSWSISGQYTIKTLVRCSYQLHADTLKSPLLVLAHPVLQNVVSGMYRSGFFIRMVGAGNGDSIDFSQGTDNPPLNGDLVFSSNTYSFSAKGGLISPGLYDSLPELSSLNCIGAASEATTVCQSAKWTIDSLVGALNILCPSVMPDTVMTEMDIGQFCLVKTHEEHYAILIKIDEYIGGIDREYYYWGYQSDGSRLLHPGSTVVSDETNFSKIRRGLNKMRLIQQENYVRLILPDERLVKEVAIYSCNGAQIHCNTIT